MTWYPPRSTLLKVNLFLDPLPVSLHLGVDTRHGVSRRRVAEGVPTPRGHTDQLPPPVVLLADQRTTAVALAGIRAPVSLHVAGADHALGDETTVGILAVVVAEKGQSCLV